MSIYDNAIDSFVCGVEDYRIGTEARYKSALRNVYASLLLFMKQKLWSLSPENGEAMISHKIIPRIVGSNVVFVAAGIRTIDTQDIEERFRSLKIKFNWKKFNEISKARNEIEHKYTSLKPEAVHEIITKAFIIISEFLIDEMNLDLKEEVGDDLYTCLIEIKEIFEKEKAECSKTWTNFKSESYLVNKEKNNLFCPNCASELIIINPNGSSDCKFCDEHFDNESVIEAIAQNLFSYKSSYSYKDLLEPELIECPNCSHNSFVLKEMVCANCGETCERDCIVCSSNIPICEIDGSGICGWCQRQAEKDD
ncbi:MAG: hypothetical protein KDD58_12235 [Bdellovibrionales bacterium]|nr:hypothetical protein [Bdellovibrionales bacterium]